MQTSLVDYFIERMNEMQGFLKGMGMGIVAGAMITMAVVPMDKKRVMRSPMGKTIKTIGNVCGSIHDAF